MGGDIWDCGPPQHGGIEVPRLSWSRAALMLDQERLPGFGAQSQHKHASSSQHSAQKLEFIAHITHEPQERLCGYSETRDQA
ncbi:hypothetical protein NDU88_004259 [Pleurodeles waltl]|uniref:Uncharacterized protein n=1 Tax=Pleurodeles waltl TaxID=8319 RepID=A0AAV7T980_PLEWA|nr:hypothetical protein NDU88_004259 [Pleurodeles waltl]